MELEVEIWKDVPNYEGEYLVSSFGRVKSLKWGKERILRSSPQRGGYLIVGLNGKTICVHQIVAIAFHGHIPDGHNIVVDHKDNNNQNNRADNLQLIPHRENCSKDKNGYSSEYVGVHYFKRDKKWQAKITFNDRQIHLGTFDTEKEAVNAYQKAKKEVDAGLDLNILYPKNIKSSEYMWVYWDKSIDKWRARYKGKYLGLFNTDLEAHEAVQKYILQLQEKVIILS